MTHRVASPRESTTPLLVRDTADTLTNTLTAGHPGYATADQVAVGRDAALARVADGSFEHLKLVLARFQVGLIDARRYTQESLGKWPIVETDPRLEVQVADALRACANNERATTEALDVWVASAMESRGPEGLTLLVSSVEQRRRALRAELVDKGLQKRFDANAKNFCSRLTRTAFRHLAAGVQGPNPRAAMRSMAAATELFGLGLTRESVHGSWRGTLDAFTNERGLARMLEKQPQRGGAAVGVSGGILEFGSRLEADLIVSVDSNPVLADAVTVFSGMLLVVDDLCRRHGWDDSRRAAEVTKRIELDPPEIKDRVARELRDLGLPPHVDAHLEEVLAAIRVSSVEQKGHELWFKPPSRKQEQRILHLTRLAIEGKIVAVSGNLDSTKTVARINDLLAAHHTTASSFNLSNVLDHSPLAQSTCVNLGNIHFSDDAFVGTTQVLLRAFPPDEEAAAAAGYSTGELHLALEALGGFSEPRAHPVAELFGETPWARAIEAAVWAVPATRERLWRASAQMITGGELSSSISKYAGAPTSPSQYRSQCANLRRETFGTPEAARQLVIHRARQMIPGLAALRGEMDIEQWLRDCTAKLDAPANADQVRSTISRIETAFWTQERKVLFLEKRLQRSLGGGASWVRGIDELAVDARDGWALDRGALQLTNELHERLRLNPGDWLEFLKAAGGLTEGEAVVLGPELDRLAQREDYLACICSDCRQAVRELRGEV